MPKKSLRTAFSLVEISVVLAIITAIVVGVIKSQAMFLKARLSTAQTITQNSSVKDIADLAIWYETTLESSFLFSEQVDGGAISVWQDNSSNAASKNNATQTSTSSKPKFYEKVFNDSLPAIRFDGVNDFLTFDGSPLIGSSYTIFVVEQRRASTSQMMFLGGVNDNLQLGYRSETSVTQAHSSGVFNDFTVAAYSSPTPRIHTFWFNVAAGQKYWINGGSGADDTGVGFSSALTSYSGAAIGRYLTHYLNGDIAEIIIFTRALQTTERQVVETYLSQKYNLTIS